LAKKRRQSDEGVDLVRRAIREAKNEHTRRFWQAVLRLTEQQERADEQRER
jgi:hypothetical protein